jgi:hypothetical protein
MEYVHYDHIASFEEAPLDCLSVEALTVEWLLAAAGYSVLSTDGEDADE